MRVRCDFCGAEYETAVSKSALSVVNRCDRCGLSQLSSVDEGDGTRTHDADAVDKRSDEQAKR